MATETPAGLLAQVPLEREKRPRYSAEQLQTYFRRINLPAKYLETALLKDPALATTKEHGLPFLEALTRYHACNVPFENLELHYSAHKTISLNMDDLYAKFAERGLKYGRGGRCMENNGFFGTVLRSLGFEVRNCAGRVSRMMSPIEQVRAHQGATYDGWNHMLNLVRLDGAWYVVDVGMGGMGPNLPYPLRDGFETTSIAPRKIRLQLRSIAEHQALHSGDAPKLWCFDVCHKPSADGAAEDVWIPTYCFTEMEFLPQDYEMMSWFTSTNKKCFFTYSLVCTRMVMDEAGERIIGDTTLFNDGARQLVGGNKEWTAKYATEQERIDALRNVFGVHLTEEEAANVSPELKLQE